MSTWGHSQTNWQPRATLSGKLGEHALVADREPQELLEGEKAPLLPSEVGLDLNTVFAVFPEDPGLKETGP